MDQTHQEECFAVIFTSIRTSVDDGYEATASLMIELAKKQAGFLGVESARENIGITVSYWDSLEAIQQWKIQMDHTIARQKGREIWYSSYSVRICRVLTAYSFEKPN